MNDTQNLKELVQKAAAGDKESFEKLYQATCRSVYFTCLGILKDEQEAQDITQDVYMTVFEQIGTLEDAGKFKAWLYRIAANKSIKHLRKKQPILSGDEQLEDMETEENENFLPEEYALNADKRKLVLEITRKVCTDVQYQTILLYYFNELSIAEIAEIMECLEGTVKNRLSVARAKIKEGVLRYEKKSGDKLYSVAAIPFLTALFTAQMRDMQMPVLPLNFPDVRHKLTAAAQTAKAAKAAKTGGRIALKGLQLKIAVAVAAVAVVGGVTAAAVIITNQKAEEASAGAQGESAWDVADAGDSEDMDTSPETDIDGTQSDEDALQGEADSGDDSSMSDESEGTEKAETKATGTDGKTTAPGEDETAEEAEATENANKTSSEQTAEPEYTYTDMSATMYATQTVNIRTLPSTDGEKVGSLSANQEINITGQCNETSWYRFEYNGQTAYVSNNYVSDTKIEVAATEPAQSASSGGGSSSFNINDYPVSQWIDFGDWFLYIHPVYGERPPFTTIDPEYMDIVNTLQARYPDDKIDWGHGIDVKGLGVSVYFVDRRQASQEELDFMNYVRQFK